MKTTFIYLYFVCLFFSAIGQSTTTKKASEEIYNKSLVTDGFKAKVFNLPLDIYLRKGKYLINNNYEPELIFYYDKKIWSSENRDTIRVKRKGNHIIGAKMNPSYNAAHYKVTFFNIDREINTYIFYYIFPYAITSEKLQSLEKLTIYKNDTVNVNRLKIPLLGDYTKVVLLDQNKQIIYNKIFDYPSIPYLDYKNVDLGSYMLNIKTYNEEFIIDIVIENIFD
jgi:hypothetical protein